MPWQTASKIVLSEKQEGILKENATGTHKPQHMKTRSQIILYAAQGWCNNEIEKEMGVCGETVNRWRDRYSAQYTVLQRVETETPHKVRSTIEKILSDEQRAGAPSKFTDAQVAAIIAMACEDPAKFDLPFSHWTPQLLQIEVIKLGLVESISIRQIGRFLKRKRFTATSQSLLAQSKH